MQIPIPNKEQLDFSTLKRIELLGLSGKPGTPPKFILKPDIALFQGADTFEIADEQLVDVNSVQFKYVYSGAIKGGTWYKNNNTHLVKPTVMKIAIPQQAADNIADISKITLETFEYADGQLLECVNIDVPLSRVAVVEWFELGLEIYSKIAKLQFRLVYHNETVEVIKFNNKAQALYRAKNNAAQLCVRHKTSELFEDSDAGREQCFRVLDNLIEAANAYSKDTVGTKTLVYYTVFFDRGYVELLNKSVSSILEHGRVTFDLLLITDEATKEIIERHPFTRQLKPKYLLLDTPKDGVEASQIKLRVFDYKNIDKYDKILFLDCDVVAVKDIDTILSQDIEHDTLYTARNANIGYGHAKTIHHGFEYLGDDFVKEISAAKQMPFNAGQFLFRNSARMRKHFDNVNWFMHNWAGEYFFEQAFMCYYFCKAYLTDDSILNKYMSIIATNGITEQEISEETCLIHFIAPPLDAHTKLKFIDWFLDKSNLIHNEQFNFN